MPNLVVETRQSTVICGYQHNNIINMQNHHRSLSALKEFRQQNAHYRIC